MPLEMLLQSNRCGQPQPFHVGRILRPCKGPRPPIHRLRTSAKSFSSLAKFFVRTAGGERGVGGGEGARTPLPVQEMHPLIVSSTAADARFQLFLQG